MKNREHTMPKEIKYPRFISNAPCKEDLFEGKSHITIAKNISQLLQDNEDCNVIGIDGGWGSGKSNLVELIKKCLQEKEKEKYRFFIYDAWGHQDDLQRRSILEELTEYLTNGNNEDKGILDTNKWGEKLKNLLAKKREIRTKSIPKISCGIILSALAVITTPILDVITDSLESRTSKIIIMCIPLFLVLISVLLYIIKNLRKYRKSKGRILCIIKLSINEVFNIYTSKQKENTTFETIAEDEPSSRKFKEWMHQIDQDIQNYILIIVFDNMDRLPNQKVQELWSAIHTFFADEKYSNIKVIVPFDREHIKSAFKNENIKINSNSTELDPNLHKEEKCFGDDFINKTFNVVYRVSPPTMSNWKSYFKKQWNYAFGKDYPLNEHITQIYDLLTIEQTPRKIIAFINEFISIKQLMENDNIPDKYIALFIMGKNKISNSPIAEILQPTYLGALDFIYKNDQDMPKYMSALYYQLPVSKALDIIYTERLKQALENKDIEQLKQIQIYPDIFFSLLENVITKISNIPNTILSLDKCLGDQMSPQTQAIWDCLHNKAQHKEDSLQEYQKILVQKITEKEKYLQSIIADFTTSPKFNAKDYYNSITQLGELKNINPYKYLTEKEVKPEIFLDFVEIAQNQYNIYKIACTQDKLNEYFVNLGIERLQNLTSIPYIKNTYDIHVYINHIKSLIDNNNKEHIAILYKRLKEVERPVDKIIPDNIIYSLFNNTKNTDDFYYDLICMRISRLKDFYSSYQPAFSQALNNTDNIFVEKIAEKIEYYMNLDDILVNLKIMQHYPLYCEVSKKIIQKSYGTSKANILTIIQEYETIMGYLKIKPDILINRLGYLYDNIETILTPSDISSIPIAFFKDIKDIDNSLTIYCKSVAIEYLNSITLTEWKQAITSQNSKYKLLIILEPKIQNCFDAFKEITTAHAKGEYPSLTKKTYESIINLAIKNHRSLVPVFNTLRDLFCGGQVTMTPELFEFYGDLLFQYSDLQNNNSSLRTIFNAAILNKPQNINLIIKNQEKMVQVINKAEKEDRKDFRDKIQSLLNNEYKNDESFETFVKIINIEEPSIHEPNNTIK